MDRTVILESFQEKLTPIYGEREAISMAKIYLDYSKRKQAVLTPGIVISRLVDLEPIQYILEESFFYESFFKVNSHTLIPRPETEELVDAIYKDYRSASNLRVLDIGTGTGCIPISLKLKQSTWDITGMDISEEALVVAKENSEVLRASVSWMQADVLNIQNDKRLPTSAFDIIVSNPPYIPNKDKSIMHENVLKYEPELALFVPDKQPLVFYEKIVELAMNGWLKKGGRIYFEIHQDFGQEMVEEFNKLNVFSCEVIQDLQGNDRILKITSN